MLLFFYSGVTGIGVGVIFILLLTVIVIYAFLYIDLCWLIMLLFRLLTSDIHFQRGL
jgi:hypothetical protein